MRLHLSVVAIGIVCMSSSVAQDLPTRRAGLWEVTMTQEGRNTPPQVMQQCTDASTDKLMNAFGGDMGGMCSQHEIRRVGATIVINATCQIGPMKSVSQSVVSGDFNSNYTVKTTSKVEGMPQGIPGMAGGSSTVQARWVGACKADQQPGDVVMPDGRKMNIKELRKMMDGLRPPNMPK
jgi:hypothetical protein